MIEQVEVEGGRLAVEVEGSGPLVVCVHGMGDDRRQFRKLAPALVAAGYRVAAIDVRGHGASDLFAAYGPEHVGRDVLAVIARLGGPAVVVGHSSGGAAAVWAAAEAPDQVCALALLGPVLREHATMPEWLRRAIGAVMSAGPWGRWFWLAFYRSLFKGGAPDDQDAHVARLAGHLTSRARLRALWEVGTLSKAGCTARIPEVQARTLAVIGTADPDYPDPVAELAWLGEALSARTVALEGVGHYPHLERPDATIAAVTSFLEERCRASA